MNVRDLRTKNTVNISYNISRMENNRRMEYSNEDNNADRYKDLDDCMAKSSDIIEETDNWLTGVSKTNSNKENINLSPYKTMAEMYRNSTLAQNSDIHATPEVARHFEKFPT